MSDVIVIDATQLKAAAPRVRDLFLTLARVSKEVSKLDTHGLPGPLASRVDGALSAASGKLAAAASAIEGTAEDLLRRAGLAELADQLGTLAWAAEAPGGTAALIEGARQVGTYGVPQGVGAIASRFGHAAGSLSLALNVGVPTVHDLGNPYLDDDRRVSNILGRSVTSGGMLFAGGVIIGLAGPGLLPIAGVAVAGIAFGVLDKQLGISNAVSDGVDWATDQTSKAADAVGDAVGGVVDDIF
ncbi:MAG TPA: hypothetical protein VF062_02315 [Candidatus Limnocylindrales bacterium]